MNQLNCGSYRNSTLAAVNVVVVMTGVRDKRACSYVLGTVYSVIKVRLRCTVIQECTNFGHLVGLEIVFSVVAPDIFSVNLRFYCGIQKCVTVQMHRAVIVT